MDQWHYIAILILVMLVTGLIGGFVNYALALADEEKARKADKAKASETPGTPARDSEASAGTGAGGLIEDPRLLWRSMVTGVVAAFIVPLFLRLSAGGTEDLVSSVLRSDCGGENAKSCANRAADFFVIAAFCLVAAVSARAFIQTVSQRILQQAKEATRRAEAAEAKVETAEQKVADMAEDLSEGEVDSQAAEAAAADETSPPPEADALKLLIAMEDSTYYRRSTSGLVSETKLPRGEAVARLEALVADGLVEKTISKKDSTPRWRITSNGRTLVLRERLKG